MTIDNIRKTFYSPSSSFYGRMYGNEYITIYANGEKIEELDRILKISKEDIHFTTQNDGFWYRWGWPGPDINIYYFKDYGLTWAFNIEDFVHGGELV